MRSRLLLSTLALVALAPAPATASQCQETPFERLAREADVIFVGRALTWDAELATTFAVERVYKGTVAARVVVESGHNKYAALDPPDRYLVLASAHYVDAKPGNLYVHTCGGSRRLLAPTDDLPKELGPGEPPRPSPPPGETPAQSPDKTPAQSLPVPPAAQHPPTADPTPAPPHAGCASCSLADPRPPPGVLLLVLLARPRSRRPSRP